MARREQFENTNRLLLVKTKKNSASLQRETSDCSCESSDKNKDRRRPGVEIMTLCLVISTSIDHIQCYF